MLKLKIILYLYIYLYIYKYSTIYWVWRYPFENCNTATLQRCAGYFEEIAKKYFFCKTFVNRNEMLLLLQRRNEKGDKAFINRKNCEH